MHGSTCTEHEGPKLCCLTYTKHDCISGPRIFNSNISRTAHKQRTVGLPQHNTLPRSTANSTVTICTVLSFKRQMSDFLNVWPLKIRPWPSLQTLSSIYPLTQHHIPEEGNSHVHFFFNVLLTVNLSIILDNDQLDAHLLYFAICPLQSSTCFEHCMLIIRRLNCIDAASGIVLSVSDRPVHRLRENCRAVLSQPVHEISLDNDQLDTHLIYFTIRLTERKIPDAASIQFNLLVMSI